MLLHCSGTTFPSLPSSNSKSTAKSNTVVSAQNSHSHTKRAHHAQHAQAPHNKSNTFTQSRNHTNTRRFIVSRRSPSVARTCPAPISCPSPRVRTIATTLPGLFRCCAAEIRPQPCCTHAQSAEQIPTIELTFCNRDERRGVDISRFSLICETMTGFESD